MGTTHNQEILNIIMLTPEIVKRLMDEYGLAVGMTVVTPQGAGILMNVRFKSEGEEDIGVVQFLDKEMGRYYSEAFSLTRVKKEKR